MQAEERVIVETTIVHNSNGKSFKPGAGKTEWFKDHERGPEMVVVPAGTFVMGLSEESESERDHWLKGSKSPQHIVSIAHPFAAARHAITRGQFAAFVSATDHKTEGGAIVLRGDNWTARPSASPHRLGKRSW